MVLANEIGPHTGLSREMGVTIDRCWKRGKFSYLRDLLQAIDRHRPDVVHVYYEIFLFGGIPQALAVPFLLRAIRRRGIPCLLTVSNLVPWAKLTFRYMRWTHTPPFPWLAKPFLRFFYDRILSTVGPVTTFEAAAVETLVRDYRLERSRAEVIPLGLENHRREQHRESARQHLGLDEGRLVFLFFGYLTRYKGIQLLLQAFQRHRERHPESLLLVGGGKPTRMEGRADYEHFWRDLHQIAEQIGPDGIRMLGYVEAEEAPRLFAAADLFCMPYRVHMSSSGPLVTGASWGLPMMLSGAFTDIVGNGWPLVETNVREMKEFMDRFAEDTAFRDSLTGCTADWAAGRPGLEDVADRYVARYLAMCGAEN
jgi:glycosyltransferase involved in cell wall biosynthesis